jgi:hypothetical protein
MSLAEMRPHFGFLLFQHMTNCKRLYGRRGDFLRLIDDDEARGLLSAGKAVTRRFSHRNKSAIGAAELQLADAGSPMRGFPCGLSRTISRVCVEDWPRGYWEHNQRARHWAEVV